MKILSWSNAMPQPTGYSTCQRNLLPRIDERSDHDVVQMACSGIQHSMVTNFGGIDVYPVSSQGGNLGVNDVPVVCQKEDVDLVFTHFDAWAEAGSITQLLQSPQFPPVVCYTPIDHDPAAPNWGPIWNNTAMNVPFCKFGARVMREAGVDEDVIWDPIFHGVDAETFQPLDDVGKEDLAAINEKVTEDTFVVGHFKNNQGTRAAHDRAIAAFRDFLDEEDAWDDAILYMHCSIRGENAFRLENLIGQMGLQDNVLMPSDHEYRWGMNPADLAQVYGLCDVLLNNVRGEGFGLPILEAMACGVPVIGGAYSSMPELILGEEGEIRWKDVDLEDPVVHTERGWLVPTWDQEMTLGKHSWRRRYNREHIVRALGHAYRNPGAVSGRGENAREFALEHTWDHKVEQFIDLFDAMEDRLWEEDEELGIEWETVGEPGAERGGVGGITGRGA